MSAVLQGNVLGYLQVSVPLIYLSLKGKCDGALTASFYSCVKHKCLGHWTASVDMPDLGKDDCPI